VTAVALRSIAALVMLILTATPVARIVCAHECLLPLEPTTTTEHCHKSETTSARTMTAVLPDGCSPFALTTVAMRERATPTGSAPVTAPHVPVRALHPPMMALHDIPHRAFALSARPPASSHVPLRI
jgi:hypothetical protein